MIPTKPNEFKGSCVLKPLQHTKKTPKGCTIIFNEIWQKIQQALKAFDNTYKETIHLIKREVHTGCTPTVANNSQDMKTFVQSY